MIIRREEEGGVCEVGGGGGGFLFFILFIFKCKYQKGGGGASSELSDFMFMVTGYLCDFLGRFCDGMAVYLYLDSILHNKKRSARGVRGVNIFVGRL